MNGHGDRAARAPTTERAPSERATAIDVAAFASDARAAWPAIEFEPGAFERHLTRLAESGAVLSRGHAADLFLACACVEGNAAALRALDCVVTTATRLAVRRIDASEAFLDLVAQEVRTRVLVGDPPRIRNYSGQSSLLRWLKTAALRVALNLRRGRASEPHDSISAALHSSEQPELALLRARHRADFESAIRTAITALPPRDRALLCLSIRDKASIDKLGALYLVSRATAARWLRAAREHLARETHAALRERLGMTAAEVESLAMLLRSDLDVSVVRLLASP